MGSSIVNLGGGGFPRLIYRTAIELRTVEVEQFKVDDGFLGFSWAM